MSDLNYIALEEIRSNPWQVERPDNPQALQELADSILAHGMIETPVARMFNGTVQLATGHRRLAAHRLLVEQGHPEFAQMRVRVAEITDEQIADIVIQENKQRQDLDPIAEAKFYRRYLDEFKVSQTELAKRVGCSQGEIANTLRLLELPDKVQSKLISQEIPQRHGREFLRVKDYPQVIFSVIKKLEEEHGMTAEILEKTIDDQVTRIGKPLNEQYGTDRVLFETKTCLNCSHRIKARHYWGGEKEPYCMDPECWQRKQDEVLEAASKKALESVPEEDREKGIIARLQHGQYEDLSDYNLKQLANPEECAKCEHRKLMRGYDLTGKRLEPVCIDVKCYRKKKMQKTKEDNKIKRDEEQKFSDRLDVACIGFDLSDRRILLLLLDALTCEAPSGASDWLKKRLGAESIERYRFDEHLVSLLADKRPDELEELLPRYALEVMRANYSAERRMRFHLCRLEGAPDKVELETADGAKKELGLEEIQRFTELKAFGTTLPSQWEVDYQHQDASGTLRITAGCAEMLEGLNIAKHTSPMSPDVKFELMEKMLARGEELSERDMAELEKHRADVATEQAKKTPADVDLEQRYGGKPYDKAMAERYPLTVEEDERLPQGVRLDRHVPRDECSNCKFSPTDHAQGWQFGGKVCIKDAVLAGLIKPKEE
jgi:ParB family chromosome partitioning protein